MLQPSSRTILVVAAMLSGTTSATLAQPAQAPAKVPDPYASAADQQAALRSGATTSEALVRADMDRIAAMNHAGPRLNAVITLNPHALADARNADRDRREGKLRGPLQGIPILLKDNIESDDDTAATAGSLALKDNITRRDAPLVRRLTDAGAIILGKANLSEWANYRSSRSISGWSAMGGLVRNPYSLDRTACGSSSGSAAAVAAGFVTAAIGTETDGSVTCPASINGVVGFKPTMGLVSRTYIVPISAEQDTAGPIARTVRDAALVLTAIAGSDPADAATREADAHKTDYAATLDASSLRGTRIGVLHGTVGGSAKTEAVFEKALVSLRAAGAILVDVSLPAQPQMAKLSDAEDAALKSEFKAAINGYLAASAPAVKTRSLDQLIAFNAATPAETRLFNQEIFEAAAKAPPLTDPGYKQMRADAKRLAGVEGIDRMLADAKVEVIVAASGGPAGIVDPVNGTRGLGSVSALPAIAGYPHLTLPMGQVMGLPVGIAFIGPAWADARVLSLGYAFEQATHAWTPPQFLPSAAARPEISKAYDPR